ncbi:MAG: FecR family protein [Chitinophagaceae bacterium]|nr:FecR family protein [Chitinophagaceae bacterium]MBK9532028.1 FecR family protein [Chitinophagaceae bacterium]HQW91753.1 FecR family protein [Ferruginibacter sp.]
MKEEKYWILLSKKITGEATAEELALLKEMIRDNPEWRSVMENLTELWNSKPVMTDSGRRQKNEDAYLVHISRLKEKDPGFMESKILVENIVEMHAIPVKKPFYKRWVMYATAAAFLVSIILLYPFVADDAKNKETASVSPINEIIINPGSRTKIQLPDGSQVWVNSGSSLTYEDNFKGSTREVHLDGEAYFDVVKDPSRPFIVHTTGIDIKVLGTAFNVKAYKMEPVIEATLIHGSIEVINKNRPGSPGVMLKPHEKLVYNKYPVTDQRDQRADIVVPESDAYSITIKPLNNNIADSDIVETAWVYNKLVFEDERFETLALKMERWYNLKISFENEKLKDYRISGSFVNETPEEAFKELQFLVPFRYSVKNNEVKITKK